MPKNNLEKLLDKFGRHVGIHQLKEPVPVTVQAQYYMFAQTFRATPTEELRYTLAEAKVALELLLSYDPMPEPELHDLEAIVTIGVFGTAKTLPWLNEKIDQITGDLRPWLLLAQLDLNHRIMNELVDEQQIIISSGLGGRGELMRLHGYCLTKDLEPWQPYQREVLMRELRTTCEQYGGEVERDEFGENYYLYEVLLPYQTTFEDAIRAFVQTSNEFGDFLHSDLMLTNARPLTHQYIQEHISKLREEATKPTEELDQADELSLPNAANYADLGEDKDNLRPNQGRETDRDIPDNEDNI